MYLQIRWCSYAKDSSCHGFAIIYAVAARVLFLERDVSGKNAMSGPDASDALGIMTAARPLCIRKNYCFLLYWNQKENGRQRHGSGIYRRKTEQP